MSRTTISFHLFSHDCVEEYIQTFEVRINISYLRHSYQYYYYISIIINNSLLFHYLLFLIMIMDKHTLQSCHV